MANLPVKTDFTGSAVTEGGFKTAFDDMIDFLNNTTGAVDGILDISSGTTASRPAATEGGWLRWNTDRTELELSFGTAWQQVVRSSVDATWYANLESVSNTNGIRHISTGVSNKLRVECTSGSGDLAVALNEVYITSNDTRPFRIWINGTPVFKLDSAGNLIVTGNVTANGTV